MSQASDAFENEIVTMVSNHIGEKLPYSLPDWMINEGIEPNATIVSVDGIGSKSKDNKTDVIKVNQLKFQQNSVMLTILEIGMDTKDS